MGNADADAGAEQDEQSGSAFDIDARRIFGGGDRERVFSPDAGYAVGNLYSTFAAAGLRRSSGLDAGGWLATDNVVWIGFVCEGCAPLLSLSVVAGRICVGRLCLLPTRRVQAFAVACPRVELYTKKVLGNFFLCSPLLRQ